MKPGIRKAINICSYVLNFYAILLITYTCTCNFATKESEMSPEEKAAYIKECIIKGESAETPLKIQEFENVYGITIDSVVFTNNTEPFSGYLVSTWDVNEKQKMTTNQWAANGYNDKYVRKQKTVFVKLDYANMWVEGKVEWHCDWYTAYVYAGESD